MFGCFKIITLLVVCSLAHGLDTYNLNNNQTITAKVAPDELNRIMVQDDRILKVFGMAGEFLIETEETSGQIFIRPVSSAGIKPKDLNISLITESGKTIDLVLQPVATQSATIVLKATGDNLKKANAWEQRRPFEATLKKLIIAMYQGKNIPGYKRVCAERDWQVWQDLRLREVTTYKGKRLRGVEFYVTNNTNVAKALHEIQFLLSPNIAAIAVAERNLEPKGTTKVFVVYRD